MKQLAILWITTALAGGVAFAGVVDPDLDAILKETPPDTVVSTLVYLTDQVDTLALSGRMDAERATLQRRHEVVVRALQSLAQATQGELLAHLDALKTQGRVADFQSFWIANIIRVDATPAEIRALAGRPDVDRVYFNYPIELIAPVGGQPVGHTWEPENGVQAVRAPEVWALGITGEGVLVANIDTGVDGHHPAIASRWAGVADPRYLGHPEWAWYDPYRGQNDFPYDDGGHGTHTMGTVCGGAPGDQIGVAPGAFWMAAGAIDRGGGVSRSVSDAILSFEWMVDPDGDPSTNWDVPDVCSNSWGLMTAHGYPPCDPLFWSYLDACEAAGTVIIFSAGNEGPGADTLRRPADRATDDYRTLAVGAVDAHNPSWPVASFSSRGPSYCTPTGDPAIKPDIAAPGVNVRSSIPGGGYAEYSGTSMASPHVNGVVALIRQANPDLSVDQVKQIIFDTAYDLGDPGEDNAYGWGMVDAYEAVQLALSMTTLTFYFPNGRPELVDPNGGTTIRVEVTGHAVEPEPGTGMLYYSTDGSNFTPDAMVEVLPNVYDAVFPAFECGATAYYYFSAETTDGEVVYHPYRAPEVNYTALAYSRIELVWEDDFETDQGWTVANENLDTGAWVRAIPSGSGGGRGDPPSDHDGSGRCYVTGNGYDEDVDGGPTRLTSPVLDLSGGLDYLIGYARWFYNDDGDDTLDVEISNGGPWVLVESLGGGGGWAEKSFSVADYVTPNATVQIRFTTADQPNDSVTEAGLDAFAVFAYVCDEPAEAVLPDDYTIVDGQHVSGGLDDLFDSDDARLVLTHSGFIPGWIELEVVGTATSASPTRLQFTFEGHPTGDQVQQRIKMYDYALGDWEEVDLRVMPTTDQVIRIEISDNPARFIDPGTLEMKTRIRWMGTSFLGLYGWNAEIDQTIWRIAP